MPRQICFARGTNIGIGTQTWSGFDWGPCQLRFAAVVVIPPQDGSAYGTVILPDGSTLDVQGSNTAGLQEAINYAADFGWDLFVYGAGTYSATGTYSLSAPLLFPALQGKVVRFNNVDLEFGSQITDAAFVFDSCMMVDIELTGRINAPFAAIGVRYQAASGFPLDSLYGHGHGITDSRFEFENIFSQMYGIYFGLPATSSAFYSGGTPTGNSQNCSDCIFETQGEYRKSHLHDTSVTLDVLNPTGVVLLPPLGNLGTPGRVLLPDGTELDVSGTQTSGIQEAIDYANQNNLDLAVYGRGLQNAYIRQDNGVISYPDNGFYQINAPMKFQPGAGRTIRIYNATLNGSVNGAVFEINRATDFEFEFTGQIVAPGPQSTGIYLRSHGGAIENSLFKMGSIAAGWIGFELQTDDAPIRNNIVLLRELVGAQYGFMVRATQGQPIQDNYVRMPHLHGFSVGGADLFDSYSESAVLNNRLDLFVSADGIASLFGIGVRGTGNTIFFRSELPAFDLSGGNTLINSNNPTGRPQAVPWTCPECI